MKYSFKHMAGISQHPLCNWVCVTDGTFRHMDLPMIEFKLWLAEHPSCDWVHAVGDKSSCRPMFSDDGGGGKAKPRVICFVGCAALVPILLNNCWRDDGIRSSSDKRLYLKQENGRHSPVFYPWLSLCGGRKRASADGCDFSIFYIPVTEFKWW